MALGKGRSHREEEKGNVAKQKPMQPVFAPGPATPVPAHMRHLLSGSRTLETPEPEPERSLDEAEVVDRDVAEDVAEQQESARFAEIPESMLDRSEIARFLESELFLAEAERGPFMDDIARWQKVYKAPPASGPKNFPIRNASNLNIPVVKEVVNVLSAQLVQTLLTNRPFWILNGLSEEWAPFTNDLERFLDVAAERDLGLHRTGETWILECVKYGTAIEQVDYEVEESSAYRYSLDGTSVSKTTRLIHDGPISRNLAIEDFWIRVAETDIQRSRWCGKRMRLTHDQMQMKAAAGKFNTQAVERVTGVTRSDNQGDALGYDMPNDGVLTARREATKTEPVRYNDYEIFEIWLRWDLTDSKDDEGRPCGDGKYEDILVYYHRRTKTVLGAFFHPYWHGRRPFVRIVYFPIEHCFYGEGVIAQIEELQKEISAIHNQRMDNASLANVKVLLKRRSVQGLKPGNPLYTGQIVEASDPQSDVRELQLSEIYPSTVQNEQLSRSIVERVSGVSEAQYRSAPVTRTTATAQLALLQEQSKRFDLTVRNFREGIAEVGRLTLDLYFQFGTAGKATAWFGEHGKVIDGVFRLPRRIDEVGMGLIASAPTSQQNKESKRQNALALFNLLVQLHSQLMQLVQPLVPQAMGVVAHALVSSAHVYMRRVLDSFDETDPEEILAGLAVLEKVLPAPEDLGGLASYERGAEDDQILAGLGRLEDLLRKAGSDARPSAALSNGRRDVRAVPATQGLFGVSLPNPGPGSLPSGG